MNRKNPALIVIMFSVLLLRAVILVKIAHRGALDYETEDMLGQFK